uniref:Uncharacterized protein n=1 Tax=Hanusia phi TaxID=3032 RepID=A0A7S0EUI2_9CRYP
MSRQLGSLVRAPSVVSLSNLFLAPTSPMSTLGFSRGMASEKKKARKEKKVFNNPVLPPVQERIRQLTMYKWQVHDLRVQYRNEYLQKVEAKRAAQAAKQEELQKEREAKHVEEIKKKQERAKRAYEAMLVLRAEKAKRAMEARQRFEARGELQLEKARNKLANNALEATTWAIAPDDAENMIQEAIMNPSPPMFDNRVRR